MLKETDKACVKGIGGHGHCFQERETVLSSEHVSLNELKTIQFNYNIEFRRGIARGGFGR